MYFYTGGRAKTPGNGDAAQKRAHRKMESRKEEKGDRGNQIGYCEM
jgi:hypothetical protein